MALDPNHPFFGSYPTEARDAEGRLTYTAVQVGNRILQTQYDPGDLYDYTSITEEMIVGEVSVGKERFLAAAFPVHSVTVYDDGARAELVGSYDDQDVTNIVLIESQFRHHDAQGNLIASNSIVVQDGVTTSEFDNYDAQGHLLQQIRSVSGDGYSTSETRRYDAREGLIEHTGWVQQGDVSTATRYDVVSGLPSHDTITRPGSRSDIQYDLDDSWPWESFTTNYDFRGTPWWDPYILTGTVEQADDGSVVTTTVDPVGRVDYQFTTRQTPQESYVSKATDYDLTGQHSWASFTILRSYDFGVVYDAGTETVMDDGSVVTLTTVLYPLTGHAFVQKMGERISTTDTQGRLDYVTETYDNPRPTPSQSWFDLFTFRALDFNTATGKLDYGVTRYVSGDVENMDFNAATGLADYSVTTLRDGRVLARDFDPAGRLDYVANTARDGSVLTQDIEAETGRVDYSVERWADGRMTATDYDLADTQPWTTYSISYDALGNITGTTIT